MDVATALQKRKSVRAYLDKPLTEETITKILDAARHAPSGANMQPWEVAVVSGTRKKQLDATLEQAFRDGVQPSIQYDYYPKHWTEPYKERRKACGLQMYTALEIAKEDKKRQADQWAANFRAFDAPTVLFFFLDASLSTGSYIDCGLFMQSVMLSATEQGVGSCPQAALAEYADIVKEELGIDNTKVLVAGMAMGYEDETAAVNSYRTPREEVGNFTLFFS
jgi:nitroreductase